jgi:hypothetical protein
MATVLAIVIFLIIRSYYPDLYKAVFYISIPVLLLMIIVVSSGDLTVAEGIGNFVFLSLLLMVTEIIMSKFFDKTPAKISQSPQKKKKR